MKDQDRDNIRMLNEFKLARLADERREREEREEREWRTAKKCMFTFFVAFLIVVGILIILPYVAREFKDIKKWYDEYFDHVYNN